MDDTFRRVSERKTIGYLAGISFLFNAMSGPAIPYTASNFQHPGWLFTLISYVIFTALTAFSNLFLIESMQAIPGNKHFQGDVEFSTLINFFFGPKTHWLGQAVLYGAIQSNAIQSLVLTSQSTDQFLVSVFGKTCGLSMSMEWICVGQGTSIQSPSPFRDTLMVFTFGFLITLFLCIPLFFVDMDGSITLIAGASVVSIFLALQWVSASIINGLDTGRVPAVERIGIEYGQTMGTVMMNLGCATIIPSWVNIKSMTVRTQTVMWSTIIITTSFYVTIGIFFSLGFDSNLSNNSFQSLLQYGKPAILCKISVAMFSYVMLLPAVPINFTVSYQNLVQNNVCSPTIGIFMTFVVPILVCIPLQTRDYLFLFLTWTSLIFVSTANFIFPLVLYRKAVEFRKEFNSDRILTLHQLLLLGKIHSQSKEIEEYIHSNEQLSTIPGSSVMDSPSIILSPPKKEGGSVGLHMSSNDVLLQAGSNMESNLNSVTSISDKKSFFTIKNFNILKNSISPVSPNEYPTLNPELFVRPEADSATALLPPGVQDLDPNRTSRSLLKVIRKGDSDSDHNRSYRSLFKNKRRPEENIDHNKSSRSILSGFWAIPETNLDPDQSYRSILTVKEFDKVALARYPEIGRPENEIAYLDPNAVGLDVTWLNEDVPDPENIHDQVDDSSEEVYVMEEMGAGPSAIGEHLQVPSNRSRSKSSRSNSSRSSINSLPRDRKFRAPPFRAVPSWFPISPDQLSFSLLWTMSVLCIGNLVINFFFTVNS